MDKLSRLPTEKEQILIDVVSDSTYQNRNLTYQVTQPFHDSNTNSLKDGWFREPIHSFIPF